MKQVEQLRNKTIETQSLNKKTQKTQEIPHWDFLGFIGAGIFVGFWDFCNHN